MSDLFFLYFIPLCFLVPVGFFAVLFILSKRRKKKAPSSSGAKLGPVQTNPLLKRIEDTFFEELGLPSQDFCRELGVKYPELAMAFGQSMNFGLIRYTRQHWDREPDEALRQDLMNRLICDYYGFTLPVAFTLEDLQAALGTYFKQKKILYKVHVETVGDQSIFTVTDKERPLFRLEHTAGSALNLLNELQGLAPALNPGGAAKAYLFRDMGKEIGVIFVSPTVYHAHLAAFALLPVGKTVS